MGDIIKKWTAGLSYGPVLTQTDLYLLNTTLEIHPILLGELAAFSLNFNLVSGHVGGFNPESRDNDLPFARKDEPATMPRIADIIIITKESPWCTFVHNERGVTMSDITAAVWKEYNENLITEAEFNALPPRIQEQVKRHSAMNQAGGAGWPHYGGPPVPPMPARYRRCDWLRERIHFEKLDKKDRDEYIKSRLGYTAPNIFVMSMVP